MMTAPPFGAGPFCVLVRPGNAVASGHLGAFRVNSAGWPCSVFGVAAGCWLDGVAGLAALAATGLSCTEPEDQIPGLGRSGVDPWPSIPGPSASGHAGQQRHHAAEREGEGGEQHGLAGRAAIAQANTLNCPIRWKR